MAGAAVSGGLPRAACISLATASLLCIFPSNSDYDKPPEPDIAGGYRIVAKVRTAGYANDVAVCDTFAYIAQGEAGLAIVNIANPASPSVVSTLKNGVHGYSRKILFSNSMVYIAAGTYGVNVIDARFADAPEFQQQSEITPAKNIHILNKIAYIPVSDAGIRCALVAKTFPFVLERGGKFGTPGFANGCCATADGARLLVACGEAGFAIYTISHLVTTFEPCSTAGTIDLPGYAEDVLQLPETNYACLACGTAGVRIVDFSDTLQLQIAGSFSTGGYAKEMCFANGRLYVATETRGVQILSLDSVSNPTLLGVVKSKDARAVAVQGKYLYVADLEEGLIVIEIP